MLPETVPTATDAVLLRQLSHRYGKTQALRAVDLALPAGATIALIGPDGVGKSTLLSLVAGIKIIQSGQVQVLGGDMADKKNAPSLVAPHCLYAARAGAQPLSHLIHQ